MVNFEFSASEDSAELSVLPEDKNLWFKVVGGAYEPGSAYPTCDIEFVSTPTHRKWSSGDWWDCVGDNMEVRLNLITPTTVSLSGGKAVFPLNETRPKPIKLGETPGDSQESDQPAPPPSDPTETPDPSKPSDQPDPSEPTDPNPPVENPDNPGENSSGSLVNDAVTISRGHVDIGPAVVDDKVSVVVNDDSREHARTSVARTPDSVTLQLLKNSKVKRSPKAFSDPVFDFMGPQGTELFVSPMQQKNGIVWPGFSSEHIDRASFPNGVKFEIAQKTAPAGGSWWLFTHDSFNGLDLIASTQKPGQIDAPEPLHKHVYWAFTKPGMYVLTVSVSGTDADGNEFRSSADIRFKVGDEDEAGSPGSEGNPDAAAVPGDSGAGDGSTQPGGAGEAPGGTPGSSKPHGAIEPARPGSEGTASNGVLPPHNPAQGGANGFGSGSYSSATVSRGGGAAVASSGLQALSSLPAAEGLQSDAASNAETTETAETAGSASPLDSDASDGLAQPMFGASPISTGDQGSQISIPLIIIVASSIVALAAAVVLLRRKFAKA